VTFSQHDRRAILNDRATGYIDVALTNIVREYPHMPSFIATGPDSYRTHRELHPAFFGCFDWHSAVEMHWVVVRILRRHPGLEIEERARATLNDLLTPEQLERETAFFRDPAHRTLERPYGWGWLLTLYHEMTTWDDADARRWAGAIEPLANVLMDLLVEWIPLLTYPQRIGMHSNTAFGLSRAWDAAELHKPALLAAIREAALRWFRNDTSYPAQYEPSGADFLSPALCEAELMSRALPSGAFPGWLERFLPGIGASLPDALFTPALVSDATDGQIAHLTGLNLSRSWAFVALATALLPDDPRVVALEAAAERHAAASLSQVAGSDYMVEHWLAAYATLLLGA
jgi:hypothetical protein